MYTVNFYRSQTQCLLILLKILDVWKVVRQLNEYSRFVSVPMDVIDALKRLFYDGELIFLVSEFTGK